MNSALIIDDDPRICLLFSELLTDLNLEFKAANTLSQARILVEAQEFDLVFLDLELPDGNGLDFIPELNALAFAPEVIIVTGTGNARGAELAFKYGAWDYVQKPFLLDDITLPITRAIKYRKEKQTHFRPVPLVRKQIIGESAPIRNCLKEVAQAAATNVSVLISGETGTGKELFARAIHENSARSGRPFVAVDCGALPDTLVETTLFGHNKGAFTGAAKKQEGLITMADQGTLMLDEVGDLPLAAQKSLLRTLQERSVRPVGGTREIAVDIRLIAATHLDLDRMVEKKLFRKDLLYRIQAMKITLPPLRDRGKDIEEITIKKIHELADRYQMPPKALSRETLSLLSAHSWPGNVRELLNLLQYALAAAGADPTIFPKHLPVEYRMAGLEFEEGQSPAKPHTSIDPEGELPSLVEFRNQAEKAYLKELILRVKGNRKAACKKSGISQSRLYGLLDKHNLPGFGSAD